MNRILALSIAMLAIGSLPFARAAEKSKPHWEHKKGVELSLLQDAKPVLTYHFDPKDNSPYFHPVSVAGGPVMSALHPADHLWHKGLWFSWKYLNDVNFWDWTEARGNNPKWPKEPVRTPDGWTKMQGDEAVVIKDSGAVIEMALAYGKGEQVFMKEERRIQIDNPEPDGSYTINWRSKFTAGDKDVVIDRAEPKPTTGGYAGLGLRAVPGLKDTVFTNSQGTTGQACRGQKANWVDMTGVIDPQFGPTGVAIFDHPKNLRHPESWHVQAIPPFFYFNAALVYHEPYTLKAGESMTLRYRVLVHKGKLDAEKLNKIYEAFAKTK